MAKLVIGTNSYDGIPVIVKGGGAAMYGVTIPDIMGVNENGILMDNGAQIDVSYDGVVVVQTNMLKGLFDYQKTEDNEYYTPDIVSFSMPDLVTLEGSLENVCRKCANLSSINFQNLEEITESYAFKGSFSGTGIEVVEFKKLNSMGGEEFKDTFENSAVQIAKFYALKTITYGSFNNCFGGCYSIEGVWFPAAESIEGQTCAQMLLDAGNVVVRFSALTSCDNADWLDGTMASGASYVSVHFPMAMQSDLENTNEVQTLFDAQDGEVLFDIVQIITDTNGNTYERREWLVEPDDNALNFTHMVWENTNDGNLYYTSGTEPAVGDDIYSDETLTTTVDTVDTIA